MQNLTFIKTTILVVIGAVVAYFFTAPLVTDIRENQERRTMFENEVSRVEAVNQILLNYQRTINSIPVQDRQKLARFLPQDIDEMILLRDIEMLLSQLNITPSDLSIGGASQQNQNQTSFEFGDSSVPGQLHVDVQFNFEETYEVIKNLLLYSELHPYIIQITNMEMVPDPETDLVNANVTVRVFLHGETFNDKQSFDEDLFDEDF